MAKKIFSAFGAASLSCSLAACTDDPLIKACRDEAEEWTLAPTTISNFSGEVVRQGLTGDVLDRISSEKCSALDWSAEFCTALNGLRQAASAKAKNDWLALMSPHSKPPFSEDQVVRVVRDLPPSQQKSAWVTIRFDAANKFNTPVRHEMQCLFVFKGIGPHQEPYLLDDSQVRGFE